MAQRKKPYAAWKKRRALEMHVPGVFGYKRISKALGVPVDTVRMWIKPTGRERQNRASAAAKRKRTGICIDCGGLTRYSGYGKTKVGTRCHSCMNKFVNTPERIAARTIWSREKIIAAFHEWEAKHGKAPTLNGWQASGPGHPSATTVIRYFGTWNTAMEAAGFEARLPTHRLHGSAGEPKKGEDR